MLGWLVDFVDRVLQRRVDARLRVHRVVLALVL